METTAEMKILHESHLLRKALNELIHLQRRPHRILIMAMNVKDFKLDDEKYFLSDKLYWLLDKYKTQISLSILIGGRKKPNEFNEDIKSLYKKLENAGAQIYFHKGVHAKLIVVSGKEKASLITSANFTKAGFRKQMEIGLVSHNLDQKTYNFLKDFIISKIEKATPVSEYLEAEE